MVFPLKEYIEIFESIEKVELFEEDSSASTSTSGVSLPDAKPITSIKRDKFMGHTCYEMDQDSYSNLMKGKIPFKRWSDYISDETLRTNVQSDYYKNKKLLIRNEKTGTMVYVK